MQYPPLPLCMPRLEQSARYMGRCYTPRGFAKGGMVTNVCVHASILFLAYVAESAHLEPAPLPRSFGLP